MACSLELKGIAAECKGNTMGGVKEVYIIEYDKVDAINLETPAQTITEITLKDTAKFHTYAFRKGTATYTNNLTVDDAAGTVFCQSDVTLQFSKMEHAKRLEINNLFYSDCSVIVRDNNENFWFLGYDNPVTSTAGSGEAGSAMGDFNGYKITLSDMSRELPMSVDATILTGLLDGNQQPIRVL